MKDQNSKAHDLFLLMFNLSQLTIKDKIIDIFVDALSEIWAGIIISYQQKLSNFEERYIPISVGNSYFGYLIIEHLSKNENDDLDLIHNAAAMLAIILKKNEQDTFLADEKLHLQKLVDEKVLAFKESEEKFRNVFEYSIIGKSITRIDGKLETNNAFCQILGYSNDELSKLKWQEITHVDDVERDQNIIGSLISGEKKSARWEKRYIHKRGNIVWVDISTTLQCDRNGNPLYFITAINDITERKRAVKEIQDLSKFPSEDTNPVLRIGSDGIILYANNASATILSIWKCDVGKAVPDDWKEYSSSALRTGANKEIEINCNSKIFSCILVPIVKEGYVNIYGRDITERKQSEEALLKSEQEFRSLAESMPQIVWVTRADGWNIYFNQQWMDYTGLTLEESYGHGWNTLFHPEDQQPAWDAWQNAVNNNGIYSIEARLRRYDGEYRWWLVRGMPLLDENGKILKWFGTCTDIEEIKQAEITLREDEKVKSELLERMNEAQNIAKIGSWDWDIQSNQVWWSDETYRIYGVNPQNFTPGFEANGKFIHPDDFGRYGEVFEHSFQTGEPLNYDFRLVANDGQLKYCQAKGEIIYDESGRSSRFTGTIMDITERKQAEEKLEKQSDYIKMILDNFPIGIATNEIDSMKVTYMNRKFSEIYGWPENEFPFVGNFFEKVFPDMEYRQQMQTIIMADISSGDIERMNWDNLKIVTKAGDQRIVHASNIPLINQNIMVSIVQDVTVRKLAEEKIQKQLDELRRWYEVTLDREGRVMELKQEVNELLKQWGEPLRYESVIPDNPDLD